MVGIAIDQSRLRCSVVSRRVLRVREDTKTERAPERGLPHLYRRLSKTRYPEKSLVITAQRDHPAGRQMVDRHHGLVGEALRLTLPEADAGVVAAVALSRYT